MKESRLEHQRKLEAKENLSALKGRQENAINGKPKDSAQEETLEISATTRIIVKSNATVLSCSKTADAKRKFFERRSSQRPESVWDEISKTVQTLH